MTHFVAIVWDERNSGSIQCASRVRGLMTGARDWTCATDGADLAVYIHPTNRHDDQPILLQDNAGIILGTLFKRSAGRDETVERRRSIDERQTREIQRTHGRSLIDSDWGAYILLLRRPREHIVSVLRGPAGALPCYYMVHERCTFIVSDVADLLPVCTPSLSINWDSIRAQAAAGDYLTRETGLHGIMAVISGECIDINENRIEHRCYWSPTKPYTDPVGSLSEAAALVHLETHRCVSAWASLHETILLLLSGGLDSSIVLACLRTAPSRPRVVAVNFYSEGPGDERQFARSMAERTDTHLEEVPSNLNIDLRKFENCALTPSPVLNFAAFDVEPAICRMARKWSATAAFTGEIGDDVLGHASSPEALAELLQRGNRIGQFLVASLDYAELARISVWRAMHQAHRHLQWLRRMGTWSMYQHRQLAGQSNDCYLIAQEAATAYEGMLARFTHPWFQDAKAMQLGKAMLIQSLINATSSVSQSPFASSTEAPLMSPLASQPLVEAALRIPSHMHFTGAENGAVVRTAFHSELSSLVLNRGVGKGTPAAWVRSLLDRNEAFLAELLLDGMLVQRGILDRAKVETLLSRDINRTRVGLADMIRQVYIEIWLRRWIREGARA